jgi:hypothetical protein
MAGELRQMISVAKPNCVDCAMDMCVFYNDVFEWIPMLVWYE